MNRRENLAKRRQRGKRTNKRESETERNEIEKGKGDCASPRYYLSNWLRPWPVTKSEDAGSRRRRFGTGKLFALRARWRWMVVVGRCWLLVRIWVSPEGCCSRCLLEEDEAKGMMTQDRKVRIQTHCVQLHHTIPSQTRLRLWTRHYGQKK